MDDDTLARVFWNRVEKSADAPAHQFKTGGSWQILSWRRVGEIVREAALGLLVVGRQKGDAELKASDPPVTDLLTFEGKAADANVLILELPPQWFKKTSKGWKYNGVKDQKFRFRIPRSAWENEKPPEGKGGKEEPAS